MSTTDDRRARPRLEGVGGRRLTGDDLVRPLPPTLMRALEASAAGAKHSELAERWSDARTRATAIAKAITEARASDQKALARAVASGKPAPPRKVEKLEAERDDFVRQLDELERVLVQTSQELLRAAVPLLEEAEERARSEVERALGDVREGIQAILGRFEEANEAAGEAGWIAGFRETGTASPFSGARANPAPQTWNALSRILPLLEEDRLDLLERRARDERERAFEESLGLPAGKRIYRDGQEFIVQEDGTLEEVQR